MAGLDANTKLYLPFDQNTLGATTVDGALEILDSGNTGHIVTQVGTAQLSTAQSKIGSSSLLLDGNSDYLTVPDSADFYLSGDFTIEYYIYYSAGPTSGQRTIAQRVSGSSQWYVQWDNSAGVNGQLRFGTSVPWTVEAELDSALTTDTWYHVAITRSGNSWYFFLDGVLQEGVQTQSGSVPNVAAVLSIGYGRDGGTYHNGYMDEIRISDTARYTTGFTPPTTALTSDANTKLLLHMDTQDQSGDGGSGTYHIPNFINNTNLDTAQTKYATDTTSVFFDGGTDQVQVPDSADWDLIGSTSQDYTIDFCWRHFDTTAEFQYFVGQAEDANNFWNIIWSNPSGLTFQAFSGGGVIVNTGFCSTNVVNNTNWHHICLVKKGGASAAEYAIYVNGSQECYVSDNSTDTFNAVLRMGERPDGAGDLHGNIAHLRIQASNIFSASPNAGKTDTITVPTESYSVDTPAGSSSSIKTFAGFITGNTGNFI